MKVKALRSFSGAVCMSVGETRNITDEVVINDLLDAGYVECVEAEQQTQPMAQTSEPEQQAAVSDDVTNKASENVSDSDTDKTDADKQKNAPDTENQKATLKRSAKKDEAKSDTKK